MTQEIHKIIIQDLFEYNMLQSGFDLSFWEDQIV